MHDLSYSAGLENSDAISERNWLLHVANSAKICQKIKGTKKDDMRIILYNAVFHINIRNGAKMFLAL